MTPKAPSPSDYPSFASTPAANVSIRNATDEVSDGELHEYIRRNIVRAALGIAALVVALALVGRYLEAELLVATTWIYETVGFAGLAGVLLLTDSFITPVPPDMLLIVIAKSSLSQSWWVAVPTLGVLSSIAGIIGWAISRRVGNTGLTHLVFGRFQRLNAALVRRYGTTAVALGALTPIPFSITCWTAGVFQLPFNRIAWVSLLRIPRFIGYYLLIVWSVNIF